MDSVAVASALRAILYHDVYVRCPQPEMTSRVLPVVVLEVERVTLVLAAILTVVMVMSVAVVMDVMMLAFALMLFSMSVAGCCRVFATVISIPVLWLHQEIYHEVVHRESLPPHHCGVAVEFQFSSPGRWILSPCGGYGWHWAVFYVRPFHEVLDWYC